MLFWEDQWSSTQIIPFPHDLFLKIHFLTFLGNTFVLLLPPLSKKVILLTLRSDSISLFDQIEPQDPNMV